MIKVAINLFVLIFITMPLSFIVLVAAWVIHPAIAMLIIMAFAGALYRAVEYTIDNEDRY
jgi:hypothetical protein